MGKLKSESRKNKTTGKTIKSLLLSLIICSLPIQLAKHFWPPFSYVRGIRIDYLSPTFYFTDLLIISFIILNGKTLLSQIKIVTTKKSKKVRGMTTLVVLFIILNSIYSTQPTTTLLTWLRIAEYAALYVSLQSFGTNAAEKLIRKTLPIPMLYSSVIAIVQWLNQRSLGGMLYWLGERRFSLTTPGIAKIELNGKIALRPYATFPHPNALAGFLLVSLIFTLFPTMVQTKIHGVRNSKGEKVVDKQALLRYAILLLVVIALLFTFSQTNWIIAMLLYALVCIRWKQTYKKVALLGVLLAGTLLLTKIPIEPESIIVRKRLVENSFIMIQQNPWLGVGLGSFIPTQANLKNNLAQIYSLTTELQPVHNIFLLLLAEVGIVAGLIIFAMFLAMIIKMLKTNQRLGLSLLAVVATGITDHYWLTLYQNQLLITILISLMNGSPKQATVVQQKRNENENKTPQHLR